MCIQTKLFLSETTFSFFTIVGAFKKQYLRIAFLNFKSLCYSCFEVRMFDLMPNSRLSPKNNLTPPCVPNREGGSAKKYFFKVFREKKQSSVEFFVSRKNIFSITLKKT